MRDDVLLWLNDRLGKPLHVAVKVARGDSAVVVIVGDGTLAHWSDEAPERSLSLPREDLAGCYSVGETRFDVTNLRDARVTQPNENEIEITLGDGIVMWIIEQEL